MNHEFFMNYYKKYRNVHEHTSPTPDDINFVA